MLIRDSPALTKLGIKEPTQQLIRHATSSSSSYTKVGGRRFSVSQWKRIGCNRRRRNKLGNNKYPQVLLPLPQRQSRATFRATTRLEFPEVTERFAATNPF